MRTSSARSTNCWTSWPMSEQRAQTGFWSDSRHLAALAVPIALTQLAQVALTTTDTLMMGLIGTVALAAGGLAIVLFNQVRTMGVGLVTAVGNQVAAANARDSAVRLGVPIAATYGSEAGFFSVVALIMGTFGASALAAHTVVNQLVYLVFQVTIGLSHAASISVSGEVTAGRIDAAARVSRLALIHGAAVMAIVAVVYLAAPGIVLRPFLDPADSTTFGIAASLLMIAALMQFFDCAQNIGVGLLRGVDDTRSGFRLTLIGYWLIGLPAAWFLGPAVGMGPVGVWLGLMCGLAVTAALLLRRFTATLAQRRRLRTNAPGLAGQPP